MRTLLLLRASFGLATALLYVHVGRVVLRRPASRDARLANTMFSVWWFSFGTVEFLSAAYALPASFGVADLSVTVALLALILLGIVLALWALLYYLAYLYTGLRWLIVPLSAACGLLAVGMIYLVSWMDPVSLNVSDSGVAIRYLNRLTGAPAVALNLAFSVPILAAALGYGSLFFRVHAPEQRFRIATVSLGFLGWFGWSAASSILRLAETHPDSIPLFLSNATVGIASALVLLIAFQPPAWLRTRIVHRAPRGPEDLKRKTT